MQAMTSRAGDMQGKWEEASHELETAQKDHDEKSSAAQHAQRELQSADEELASARERKESQQAEHVQRVQAASELNQRIASHQSVIDASSSLMSKTASRKEAVADSLEAAVQSASQLASQLDEVESQAGEAGERLKAARHACTEFESEHQSFNDEVTSLRQRHAVIGERVALLEEIEQRMEGVGSGVKKLLKMQLAEPDGPLSACLLYTSPSPRDATLSRMPSSA